MSLSIDKLREIEARIEKYQNTPQSVGDTDYLTDKIAGDDAPALLAEVKRLRAIVEATAIFLDSKNMVESGRAYDKLREALSEFEPKNLSHPPQSPKA